MLLGRQVQAMSCMVHTYMNVMNTITSCLLSLTQPEDQRSGRGRVESRRGMDDD